MSQGELARRVGVSQAAVSTWESGTRQPGVDELYAVAQALDIEVFDLLPRRAGPPLRAALRAVADQLELAALGGAMEDFVDQAEVLDRPERNIWTKSPSPDDAAQELLDSLGIARPPVDVEGVAAQCGIPVLPYAFDDALSGLVIDTSHGPVIGVNDLHAPNRQRFTIAHELGHVLLRHLESFHIDLGSTSEDGNPPGYNWRHERAANEFAAALLMPARLVEEAFAENQAVAKLARLFQVSELAMGFRARTLELR